MIRFLSVIVAAVLIALAQPLDGQRINAQVQGEMLSQQPGDYLDLPIKLAVSSTPSDSQCEGCRELETQQLELGDCIFFSHLNKQHVIRDEATMKSMVRHDGSREKCLAKLKDVDFDKHSLVGRELNTGWCDDPPLTYRVYREEAKKRYLLSVVYEPSPGSCRALSQYFFWVLVPKLPEGYEVVFEVKAGAREK